MPGDSVNPAARLEGINKQFGTYAMISEFLRNEHGEPFDFREMRRVAAVGRKQAVTVYESCDRNPGPSDKSIYYDAKKFFREITGGMCYLLHD